MRAKERVAAIMPRQSRKQDVIEQVFSYVRQHQAPTKLVFDNQLVKRLSGTSFSNQFDVTKVDTSAKLPQILRDNDFFIVHLGGGRHQFVKGISVGFHRLEPIAEGDVIPWRYRPSVLNEADTSEANILALVSNQRILHDFLYEDVAANPKVYMPRRTKATFAYHVGPQQIQVASLQIEIDLTVEDRGAVAICEAKNGQPDDFAVYQLYHPFRYFCNLRDQREFDIHHLLAVFVNKSMRDGKTSVQLREYEFLDETQPGSIQLKKSAHYELVRH